MIARSIKGIRIFARVYSVAFSTQVKTLNRHRNRRKILALRKDFLKSPESRAYRQTRVSPMAYGLNRIL